MFLDRQDTKMAEIHRFQPSLEALPLPPFPFASSKRIGFLLHHVSSLSPSLSPSPRPPLPLTFSDAENAQGRVKVENKWGYGGDTHLIPLLLSPLPLHLPPPSSTLYLSTHSSQDWESGNKE